MTYSEGYYIAGIVVFAAAGAGFLMNRRQVDVSCPELVRRLYPHQLQGIHDLVELPEGSVDHCNFWARTHGVRGLWKRWRNSVVLLQLCQLRGTMEPISPEEMRYVMERAQSLAFASLSALIFGLAASCMPDILAAKMTRKGQRALRIYGELAYRTHALYSDDAVPLCAYMLVSVL